MASPTYILNTSRIFFQKLLKLKAKKQLSVLVVTVKINFNLKICKRLFIDDKTITYKIGKIEVCIKSLNKYDVYLVDGFPSGKEIMESSISI